MGDGMARNLIKGGRDVVVWNRTGKKAVDFSKDTGCETAQTPKEVYRQIRFTRFRPIVRGGCGPGVLLVLVSTGWLETPVRGCAACFLNETYTRSTYEERPSQPTPLL